MMLCLDVGKYACAKPTLQNSKSCWTRRYSNAFLRNIRVCRLCCGIRVHHEIVSKAHIDQLGISHHAVAHFERPCCRLQPFTAVNAVENTQQSQELFRWSGIWLGLILLLAWNIPNITPVPWSVVVVHAMAIVKWAAATQQNPAESTRSLAGK